MILLRCCPAEGLRLRMPVAEVISTLNLERGLQMPVDQLEHRKESLYFELLPELKAVPEVLEHIEAQQGRIPFGVVSGSRRESVMPPCPRPREPFAASLAAR